jgi:DNA-binding transcriptional regulator YdaS (Cro superfamily)
MDLKQYLQTVPGASRRLQDGLQINDAYLRQMAGGVRAVSPARCVQIERLTGGVVSRRDLRPDDWRSIWPELDTQPTTP